MPKEKHLALFIVSESTSVHFIFLILLLKCTKKGGKNDAEEMKSAVEKCRVTC